MTIELKVPEVGESVTEVYIGEWLKSEGDYVERDEEVVELESEKATFEAPAPSAGVLTKILKQTGESASIGEVLAHIDETAEAGPEKTESGKKPKKGAKAKSAGREEKTAAPPAEEETTAAAEPEAEEPAHVMPAAQRLLEEHGLRPEDVEATGPGGRLLKEDVLRYVKEGRTKDETEPRESSAAEQGRREETVPMTPIRRQIADSLVKAQQQAALLTTFNEIDMAAVRELRKQYREAFQEKYGTRLGIMSFFVKAVIDALKQFPQLNAEIRGTDIVYKDYYDIGIAIGGGKGLVVPVLRNAERMSFAEIEQAINDFARRAQDNKLSLAELRGGTFTISNGGVYGSLLSTPIVNPPQSGVLGMHAIQERPVVRDGEIVVRPMMYVALSYDHRIVDGREAVTCLRRIKEAVEDPSRMLLEV